MFVCVGWQTGLSCASMFASCFPCATLSLLCRRIGLAWWDILRGCRGPTSSFFFFSFSVSGGAQLLLLFRLRLCYVCYVLALALSFALPFLLEPLLQWPAIRLLFPKLRFATEHSGGSRPYT